jgi:uncharacterized phage protein gp47/JayE
MPIEFDANGLRTQSLSEIIEERRDDWRNSFSTSFNVETTSPAGKMIAINAERETLLQEAIRAVFDGGSRANAKGIFLDFNAQITGQSRQPEIASSVDISVNGTSSTSVDAGALTVNDGLGGASFTNIDAFSTGTMETSTGCTVVQVAGVATLTIGTAFTIIEDGFVFLTGFTEDGYNKLAQMKNVTASTFEYFVDSGLTSPDAGTGTCKTTVQIPFQADIAGPTPALSGTLNTQTGFISGIARVGNYSDAAVGADAENDAEFRFRIQSNISIAGGGFREAIIAKLLDVVGVTAVNVFENTSNIVDPDGRPPGSIECFVEGGTDVDVSTAIFNAISDGVRAFGNITEIITDSQGQPVTIQFSRLVQDRIYVEATITKNTDPDQGPVYPGGGDDDIKTALAAIEFEPGQDVWETTLKNAITSAVAGIITLSIKFDTVFPPVNTATIVILPTNVANIGSGDVTIV